MVGAVMVMTHRERWAEIAVAFDTPPEERTERQSKLALAGLCWAHSGNSKDWEQVCEGLSLVRCGYLFSDSRSGKSLFWFPCYNDHDWTREYDYYRATFAGFVAAMTEEEFNQILGVTQ